MWSPDEQQIALTTRVEERWRVVIRRVGGGTERELYAAAGAQPIRAVAWTAAGEVIFHMDPRTLWKVPAGGGAPSILVTGAEFISSPDVSHDGAWLTYVVGAGTRQAIYVSPVNDPSGRLQVPHVGGREPHWCRDGAAVCFTSSDRQRLLEIPVMRAATGIVMGAPKVVLETAGESSYVIALPNGRGALARVTTAEARTHGVTVRVNWNAAAP